MPSQRQQTPPLITLTTDFGTDDIFVGVMKGVILGINPAARIVDLTHGIPPQAVSLGALLLRLALPYFPAHTIHVAVVDPGVGGARRPVCVETPAGILVGPDNGLLAPAAARAGIVRVIDCTATPYRLPRVGATFHGRDVFAPVAAHLSRGVPLEHVGRAGDPADPGHPLVTLALPEVRSEGAGAARQLRGEVIYVDRFGNLITNISAADLEGFPPPDVSVSILGSALRGLAPTYSAVPERTMLALVDSWGLLEIAERNGSARERTAADRGTPVVVTACPIANQTSTTTSR
jgi:S-adenosylmethionine hydrolase